MAQKVTIYRPLQDDPVQVIEPDENSVQEKAFEGVNELRLTWELNKSIQFKINDYADLFGERYFINRLPEVKKSGKFTYTYTCTLSAYQEDLKKVIYMFLGDDNSLKETDFSLRGTPTVFLKLLISNLQRVYPGGSWNIGEALPAGEQTLTFSQQDCYAALQAITEAFDTEFWIFGQTIYMVPKRLERGFTFEQGIHRGLYEVNRLNINDQNLITRLIVTGSDKNLPANYRNGSQHLLMTDGIRYVEKNVDIYGVIEGVKVFDDVYPHRTGVVTGVDAGNPYVFTDTTIDFNVNSFLLPGVSAKVTFNTGQLTGYTMELLGFNNGTKEFTMLKNKDEKVIDIPSNLIRPAIGDTYVLVDIYMPQTYIDFAEEYLRQSALIYLNTVASPQVSYQVIIDPKYMKEHNRNVDIGDAVFILDTDLGLDRKITVMNVIRNVVNEWQYTIILADKVDRNPLDDIINVQLRQNRRLNTLLNRLNGNAILNNNIVGSPRATLMDTITDVTGYEPLYRDPTTGRLVIFQGP